MDKQAEFTFTKVGKDSSLKTKFIQITSLVYGLPPKAILQYAEMKFIMVIKEGFTFLGKGED